MINIIFFNKLRFSFNSEYNSNLYSYFINIRNSFFCKLSVEELKDIERLILLDINLLLKDYQTPVPTTLTIIIEREIFGKILKFNASKVLQFRTVALIDIYKNIKKSIENNEPAHIVSPDLNYEKYCITLKMLFFIKTNSDLSVIQMIMLLKKEFNNLTDTYLESTIYELNDYCIVNLVDGNITKGYKFDCFK